MAESVCWCVGIAAATGVSSLRAEGTKAAVEVAIDGAVAGGRLAEVEAIRLLDEDWKPLDC